MIRKLVEAPTISTSDAAMLRNEVAELKIVGDLFRATSWATEKRRENLTKLVVNALRVRYNRMVMKTGYKGSLPQWLNGKQMEDTYLHASFYIRQFWSSRPIRLSLRPDYNLFRVDPHNTWYYDLIGQKLSTDQYVVVVKRSTSSGLRLKNSPTVLFESIPLPPETTPADDQR